MSEPPNRAEDPASEAPIVDEPVSEAHVVPEPVSEAHVVPEPVNEARVADEPVNEARVALYARLMEAQERIAHNRFAAGVSHQAVIDALDAADEQLTEDEQRHDLFLASLAHYVEALGGRLEVHAVFADEKVLVRRESRD